MEEIVIKTNYTGRVLKIVHKGVFKNHTFVVTHTDDGFYNWYCGYVEVKEGHPYFNKNYEELNNIDCHGGLTYSGKRFEEDNNFYIGFDTNHFNSNPCNNLAFVENECMNIIEQLIKLKN